MDSSRIEHNFGKGFLFSEESLKITNDDLKKYTSGNLKKPYDSYNPGRFMVSTVMVYTDGYYPKVVRLYKSIPTFDSSDREYDSWRELYLAQEQNGNIHAVFCTGGYRIATLQSCTKVLEFPDALKQYFTDVCQ